MTAILLTAIAFSTLYVFWKLLDLTFDLIGAWHDSLREQARADGSVEALSTDQEKESSAVSSSSLRSLRS